MSLMNISIVGNLACAPEQISFASGRVKTILVVAVNPAQPKGKPPKQGSERADYFRVEIWGKIAELASKYLDKGNQVTVCGPLVMERWTDREGHERMTPVVAATQLSFPQRMNRKHSSHKVTVEGAPEDDETTGGDNHEDDAGDLFAGARAVTVAESPAFEYRPALQAVQNTEATTAYRAEPPRPRARLAAL